MSKTAQATAAAPAREQIPRVASLHVDPERIARMWAMSPTQRLQAAQTGQLTLGETESGRCSYWITRWGWSSSTSARQSPTRSRHSGAPSRRSWPARCGVGGQFAQRSVHARADRRVKATKVALGGAGQLNTPGPPAHSSVRIASSSDTVCPAARSARPCAAAASSSSVQGSSSAGASPNARITGQRAHRAPAAHRRPAALRAPPRARATSLWQSSQPKR